MARIGIYGVHGYARATEHGRAVGDAIRRQDGVQVDRPPNELNEASHFVPLLGSHYHEEMTRELAPFLARAGRLVPLVLAPSRTRATLVGRAACPPGHRRRRHGPFDDAAGGHLQPRRGRRARPDDGPGDGVNPRWQPGRLRAGWRAGILVDGGGQLRPGCRHLRLHRGACRAPRAEVHDGPPGAASGGLTSPPRRRIIAAVQTSSRRTSPCTSSARTASGPSS